MELFILLDAISTVFAYYIKPFSSFIWQFIQNRTVGGKNHFISFLEFHVEFWCEKGIGNEDGAYDQLQFVMQDEKIDTLKAGYNHSYVKKSNGEVIVFGEVISLFPTIVYLTDVSLLIPKKEFKWRVGWVLFVGNMFTFKSSFLGLGIDIPKCGTPTLMMKNEKINHISLGYIHSLILMNDGELLGCGSNRSGSIFFRIFSILKNW